MFSSNDDSILLKVLKLLKSYNLEYISGQDICDKLKISRTAVWKHIKKIRSLGYKIESKQNRGYRITKSTTLPLPWEITSSLKTKQIGKRVYYFDTIDSTQNFASKISNQDNSGTLIIAQRQTSGKGRLGRKWTSPAGGIWLSVIFQPKFDVSYATLFPIASSLALGIAIEKTLNLRPELKWPNDITINGKKVAGMLVDISIESNQIEHLILGVGINYKVNAKKLNAVLKKSEHFYGTDSLLKKNQTPNPTKLIQSFLYELEQICDILDNGNVKLIIKRWTAKSSTIGKKITVDTSESKITGKAVRIDYDGALVISKNGSHHRILVGDVNYLRVR
ncbi:MAG: biotin--[acetyl-CoA-carboxylase] ligase [Thaumarchaeota archaeon]|nr:biotin--[acetyl-CoA-carboxylase] ligase [Nitrososphaerota archaeon]